MKALTLITSLAAAATLVAVTTARAQSVTNLVTFKATAFGQGATNDINGVTTYASPVSHAGTTTVLLQELGQAINGPAGFTSAAKLVLLTGNGGNFAVIDGANYYDLSSAGYDIMNVSFPSDLQIISGKQSDTTVQKSTTELQLVTVTFDDSGYSGGSQLMFTLTGLAAFSETKTPLAGKSVHTDSVKAKISDMTGTGSRDGVPFVATGSISFSGSATLPN